MPEYKLFEFSGDFIENTKKNNNIPVNFYNKNGQILIYKKEGATNDEVTNLLKFIGQGIYYNVDDKEKLGLNESEKTDKTPDGLSDTKLLTEKHAEEVTKGTEELFSELKKGSLTSIHTRKTNEKMENLFDGFASQPDAMNGLVNILELMDSRESEFDVELAVKRTVVGMALKTRGMHAAMNYKDQKESKRRITNLMMSSMFCDIGNSHVNIPKGTDLTSEQMKSIKNHPLYSYLMVAHEPTLSTEIKNNILTHHRPKHDDANVNNYPKAKPLMNKLEELAEKFRKIPAKRSIANDIEKQMDMMKANLLYNEDPNVLAISSEFASLASNVPWRKAFSPEKAVKMIINNSYFTYTNRIVREFLDYIAISLCDNNKVIKEGDFIVVTSGTHNGGTYFEVCRIDNIGRFQSRPGISRIATIEPIFTSVPKLRIKGFDMGKIKIDRRKAHYELTNDDSRNIVYIIDPEYDKDLYNGLTGLLNN